MTFHHIYESFLTMHGLYDHFVNGSIGSNILAGLIGYFVAKVKYGKRIAVVEQKIHETHAHVKKHLGHKEN